MREKKGTVRTNIKPEMLRGEREFAAAFGIKSGDTQAKLRAQGMPCYYDGAMFVYDPKEVKEWMKEKWKLNLPEIKL
jgi:hypothetical protein